jgi:hypothetical protein
MRMDVERFIYDAVGETQTVPAAAPRHRR